ncbi:MAG: M48 family peptidase, partial [Phycisphaerales bacterium]
MTPLARRALPAAIAAAAAIALLAGTRPADDDKLRMVDGHVAFGEQPTARILSVAAVNSDKVMKLLLRSERFE